MMRLAQQRFVSVLALTLIAATAWADGVLSLVADTVDVPLTPRNPGRSFVRLPSLEFTFTVDVRCDNGLLPGPLTISVADSYKSLSDEQLSANPSYSVMLRVPAKQIAPVAIDNFCVREDSKTNRSTQLLIREALSAQASLVCGDDTIKKSIYVSQPLDLLLRCTTPEEAAADPSTDR